MGSSLWWQQRRLRHVGVPCWSSLFVVNESPLCVCVCVYIWSEGGFVAVVAKDDEDNF